MCPASPDTLDDVGEPSLMSDFQQQADTIVLGYEWMFTPAEYEASFAQVDRTARSAMAEVAKRRGYKVRRDAVRVHYSYNYAASRPGDYRPGPPPNALAAIRPVLRIRVKWDAEADPRPAK